MIKHVCMTLQNFSEPVFKKIQFSINLFEIFLNMIYELYNIKIPIRLGFMYFTVEAYLLSTFSCVWYKKQVEKMHY